MPKTDRERLIEAIAVTAELTDTVLSDAAARVFVDDLAAFPIEQVEAALVRCRRELRGRLTVGDVMNRLDDGRPGPEEAWSLIPRNESQSVVWSEEMCIAWGVAAPLLELGDEIGARMAFKEAYQTEVTRAREARRPPNWQLSQGYGPGANQARTAAVRLAVERGRITQTTAIGLLPDITYPVDENIPRIGGPALAAETLEHLNLMKQLASPPKQTEETDA